MMRLGWTTSYNSPQEAGHPSPARKNCSPYLHVKTTFNLRHFAPFSFTNKVSGHGISASTLLSYPRALLVRASSGVRPRIQADIQDLYWSNGFKQKLVIKTHASFAKALHFQGQLEFTILCVSAEGAVGGSVLETPVVVVVTASNFCRAVEPATSVLLVTVIVWSPVATTSTEKGAWRMAQTARAKAVRVQDNRMNNLSFELWAP
eukprot:851714-Amphidinium_carterae.1